MRPQSWDARSTLTGVSGVFFLMVAVTLLYRRMRPVVVFTKQGFLFSNLNSPVPWTAVEGYSVGWGALSFMSLLTITLTQSCVVPAHRKTERARRLPKKRQVRLRALNFCNMPLEQTSALFATYWQGGMARARLVELGLGPREATDPSMSEGETMMTKLSESLDAEFAQAAEESVTNEIAALSGPAAKGLETVPLYEGSLFLLISAFLLGIALLVGTVMSLGFKDLGQLASVDTYVQSMELRKTLAMGVGGIFFLMVGVYILRRRKTPIATFTEQGFFFSNLESPIPWTAVDDYCINEVTQTGVTMSVNLIITLAEGYTVPRFRKTKRTKYSSRKKQLYLGGTTFRRLGAEQVGALFATYWQGGMARARLAELGVRVDSIHRVPGDAHKA